MIIDKIEIDWCMKYANDPRFVVTFAPSDEAKTAAVLQGAVGGWVHKRSLYRLIAGEAAHFLYHSNPKERGHGYGGASFILPMHDGEILTLYGPWSSNSMAINRAFNDGFDVTEVHGNSPISGSAAATVRGLIRYVEQNKPGFGIAKVKTSGDVKYVPCGRAGQLKNHETQTLIEIVGKGW
jgi:hypothetical protein